MINLYNILQPIYLLIIFQSFIVKSAEDKFTNNCIKKAGYINCKTFNSCCDLLCEGTSSDNKCISIMGKIDREQSYCQCMTVSSASSRTLPSSKSGSKLLIATKLQSTSKSSLSKIDLIVGVLLLFIIDLLFLSMTI
ncbi:Hypothetical protein SRAE_1000101100 [Strongyloides ratti]|uniref:Uncharacterized protein n=1 Tax=Strongyloides ratti TaxID=34506 RepID=A0A090KZA6_STRRB|nr:Hypothetical protein SRAE_1000101100 [Strongyloides ratti]CEF62741.1 Hypothetical protein SRAE_1000101100 [Strongyloides ratti]